MLSNMARQHVEIITSDISGRELSSESAAVVIVSDHPVLAGRTVELDADISEVEKLESSKLTMVSVALSIPGEPLRRIILDAAAFDRLFKGNVEEVLLQARAAGSQSTSERRHGRQGAPGSSARTQSVDYTDNARFGQLHRGRVTEEEAALVRNDLVQANKNRAAAGQPPIDANDEREKKRYGL